MARTAQISKEKQQSIITLRHEGQSIQKMSRTLKVQLQKSSSSIMKLALMRTTTGKKDPELPLLQRISSLELPASEIESSVNRHISTSTVQRRLRESGLHGWIAAKKPLLKDTIKTKRLAWVKKHEQWTLDWWKSVLWSDESKIWYFWFQPPCLCETQRKWTDDLRMCGSHREAWRRRWCGVALLVTLCDLFRIQGTLNQHGYHSILQRYVIPSGLGLAGHLYFQQDNDPTHLQAV